MKAFNKLGVIGLIIAVATVLMGVGAKIGHDVCSKDYKNKMMEYFRNEYADKPTRDFMNNPDIQALFK